MSTVTNFNNLSYANLKLASEWDYEKNDILPENVAMNSHKKVWWIGKCGHNWEAVISKRNKGQNCPYCSNHKILKGFNDLETTCPKVASEWNYKKNDGLKPCDVTSGSEKKVWWRCSKGHEWITSVSGRKKGTGCPFCYKEERNRTISVEH